MSDHPILNKQKKILILAGEPSGDNLGEKLITTLAQTSANLSISIMGGVKMQQCGAKLVLDSQTLAIVGIWEALTQWRKIRRALAVIKNYIKQQQPDLVILIDYPGFNLHIAKHAKAHGCRVLFYVSPQIWGWRYKRIYKIKKRIDHMAVLFPFEKEIYLEKNIAATFVGHPMLEWVKPKRDRETILHQLKLDPNAPIIALLPGSRSTEIKRHLPLLKQTVALILKKIPQAQFILPLANTIDDKQVSDLQDIEQIMIVRNQLYDALSVSDAALCASGTVTLEVTLLKVPMLIFYKINWITYLIVRSLARTSWIGLCNIIAQKGIVKEFIQHKATARAMSTEIIRIIDDKKYHQQIESELADIKDKISCQQPLQKVASIALDLITDH